AELGVREPCHKLANHGEFADHDLRAGTAQVTRHALASLLVLDVRVDAGRTAFQLLDGLAVALYQVEHLLVAAGEPVEHAPPVAVAGLDRDADNGDFRLGFQIRLAPDPDNRLLHHCFLFPAAYLPS